MNKIILTILMIVFLFNCHHTRVQFDGPTEEARPSNVKELKDKLYYFGLTTQGKYWIGWNIFNVKPEARVKVLDLKSECPNGAYEVDHYLTWGQSILAQVSFGFYIPYTIKITCR